jgi:dCMP deaminase
MKSKSPKKVKALEISKPTHKRPSWDEYFIEIMHAAAKRATCDRGRSGSVIAKDKQVLSTGYVGSPPGQAHCDEAGHEMHKVINEDGVISEHCIRTIHAEQNVLMQAAKRGISVDGATLYCQMTPCYVCAKLIVAAGIKRVVSFRDYQRGEKSKNLFAKAGVKYDLVNTEVQKY